MLKGVLYATVTALMIGALVIFILSLLKSFKKKLNLITVAYIIITGVFFALLANDIVDVGWDFIFLFPEFAITGLFLIISLIVSNIRKRKTATEAPVFVSAALIALPLVFVLFAFIYEAVLIQRCDYLVVHNYQSGIISSDDYFLSVINGKPYKVTLSNNFYKRKSTFSSRESAEFEIYTASLKEGKKPLACNKGEGKYADKLNPIAENVFLNYDNCNECTIYYLPWTGEALIEVWCSDYTIKNAVYHEGSMNEYSITGDVDEIFYFASK